MREDLKLWAESNLLDLRKTGPHTYECGGQSFLLLEEKDGYICDQDFDLILDDREKSESKKVDWLLYKWGSKFYYTSPEEIDNLSDDNLKPFRYIGEALCTKPGYPMIGVHGMYELLNGTCDYDQWTAKAKFLGIDTLGICERNTLAGTLLFQQECAKAGLKSILGETIVIHTDKDEFLEAKVFALNKEGWKNLLLINAEINVVNSAWIAESRLLELGRNLALVADPLMMPYNGSRIIRYSQSFERLYFKLDTVVWDSEDSDSKFLNETQKYLSAGISPIIICEAYYLDKEDYIIKKDLNSIAGVKNRLSENQYFKCDDENMEALSGLFEDGDFENVIGLAYQNLDDLCASIDFKIETGRFKLPQYIMTPEESELYSSNEELFDSLIVQGFESKGILEYDNCEEYLARIEKEVDVIKFGGFVDYFLILHDIIRWCRNNDILVGFGRGSAAGCLVSFLLDIVRLDPLKYDLLFERFLTKERAKKSLPDVDTDFEANRRDDVKAYMEKRFGSDHMCSLGTYTSLQMKALLKDFCRIKGIPIQQAEYLSAIIDDTKDNSNMRASRAPWEYIFKLATRSKVLFDFIQNHPSMIEEMRLCYAQPRSASVHACATLILPNDENLYTSIPVRKGILKGKEMIVTEWEGSEIEAAGYLKEDILGIQQLDKFRMIINLVEDNYGKRVDIYSLPLDEREVYKMFGQGLNGDVFHLGSKGLTSYCVQLQPQNVDDLIAALALYRPGPMDNNFHHEYILRKSGKKRFEYQPGLEDITKKTYGLLVYQEQVMQACVNIASFSLSEADDVRKGMAKSKKKFLEEQGTKFIERGIKNGYEKSYLEDLWHQMCMFGRYGFNKCLSGSFTRLYRVGLNDEGKSTFKPTIGEMYKICHNRKYAKETGHLPLHGRYKYKGYGYCWSLNAENRLIKNKIKDIRYVGIRPTFEMVLESGKSIRCTGNHKFPTSNGEKYLEDIDIQNDLIFVSSGYEQEDTTYRFGGTSNYPQKGQQGFQENPDSSFVRLKDYIERHQDDKVCEMCGKVLEGRDKEYHHIDGDHGNNEDSNIQILCVSCHKKSHYKMGRTKMGEKGLLTHLEKIVSIESVGEEEVYDVEMEHPYHTLTIDNGIVTSNSHAACYAITGYMCEYLKWKYPLPYWITALQFAGSGSEDMLRFISEINRAGKIKLAPPDINKSQTEFYADFHDQRIFWSISKVKQCGDVATKFIFDERGANGEFYSLDEFLSRVDRSKVNKSVIENLILAGAFDEIEGIRTPVDRARLIERYRDIGEVKIQKNAHDWYRIAVNNGHAAEDWWWLLQQKRVCGLAFFDFREILWDKVDIGMEKYISAEDFINQDLSSSRTGKVLVTGIINDIERKSGSKGEYVRIRLEENYSFVWVTIWSEYYEKLKDVLTDDARGKIAAVYARGFFDSYRNENALQSDTGFQIKILE